MVIANVQAVIDLPKGLYLSLSASGLTKERIANESRKLLALKYFKEKENTAAGFVKIPPRYTPPSVSS